MVNGKYILHSGWMEDKINKYIMTIQEFTDKINSIPDSYWENTNKDRLGRIKFHLISAYQEGYKQAVNDGKKMISILN